MNELTTIDRTQREYSAAVKQALARKPQLYINGEWVDSAAARRSMSRIPPRAR
jgi:phenylacetaldehyde dehydrogenase